MRKNLWGRVAGTVLISASLAACGGGGGGGGEGSAADLPPAIYTGVTTQALLTPANSAQIVANAYGSSSGTSVPSPASAAAARPDFRLPQEMAETLRLPVATAMTAPRRIAPASATETIPGPYGGSASITMDASSDGSFTGTMSFSDYRPYSDTTFSGTATVGGKVNTTTEALTSFTISFSSLTISTGSTTFTTAGTISYVYSSGTVTMTENMLLRNDSTGKSVWLGNYIITETTGGSVSISGKFYDYDYGYVDISTTTPMTAGASDVPVQGEILFRGSNGTSARLLFTSSGYEIWHSDGTSSTMVSSGTTL